MLAGGVEGGERARLRLCFEGDPKVYDVVLCPPTRIYCTHSMRTQKRGHVIPVPIFPGVGVGEGYTQQNRPKYGRTGGYVMRKGRG